MYIGIKYEQRLKSVNKQLNSFGSTLMFHGKTKYYFKNPIVALRVAKTLNSANKNFKYSLCEIEKENTQNLIFIKTYQDFEDYRNDKLLSKENTL
ncbi:MAG: hypothetical protein E7351_04110 [Clostridiales bacterium]|nr:hypothetical protein [Clostridiales bacterium]